MSTRIFVGSQRVDAIPAGDRGFAYGDGVFETMRAHGGQVHWWVAHWARLGEGAARLRLAMPDARLVREQAASLLGGADGVLKLILTRGSGGRGYGLPVEVLPTWTLALHPLSPLPPRDGVSLRWCAMRLAPQPALAGIKHCNRLEQILARAEWSDPAAADCDADDGLLCSSDGDVVCATAANVFVLHGVRWSTPQVDRCGIAGVCRAWAIGALGAVEARLQRSDVEAADAVFLCNAARGILPVVRLGARVWSRHPRLVTAQQQLAIEHPAFPVTESS